MDRGSKNFKAIAFDFDGVILESVAIKTEAMASLFAHHPEHVARIKALHEGHAGISRFIKFDMIHRDILKVPLSPERRDELGRNFSGLVLEKVLACPFVPGAREFLETHHESTPLFVVSGTPDEELQEIVSKRGLSPYFRGIYGSNRSKEEILRGLLADRESLAEDLVFIGDGRTDYEAAAAASIAFIGRVPEYQDSPFPKSTAIIQDLGGLDRALEDFTPISLETQP